MKLYRIFVISSLIILFMENIALPQDKKENVNLSLRELQILGAVINDASIKGEKEVQAAVSLLESFKTLSAQKDSIRILPVDEMQKTICFRAVSDQIAKGFRLEYAREMQALKEKFAVKDKK